MMYGHVEKPHQRVDHLITIRDLQALKPETSRGFTAFIPWVFCPTGTQLEKEGIAPRFSATEYLRIIALSRIILNNIRNIQASWLTVGREVAEIALHSGANDFWESGTVHPEHVLQDLQKVLHGDTTDLYYIMRLK